MARTTTRKTKSTKRGAAPRKQAAGSGDSAEHKASAPRKRSTAAPRKTAASGKKTTTSKPKATAARQAGGRKSSSQTGKSTKGSSNTKSAAKKSPAEKVGESKAAAATAPNKKPKTAKKQTRKTPKDAPAPTRAGSASSQASDCKADDPGAITLALPGRKLPKTRLTAKQLREFKALLLAKRAEVAGDVEQLTDVALSRKSPGEPRTGMPIHMADIGSDNWEQEFTLGLIASEENLVREIDHALERIQNKTYGVCLATHRPISVARLQAKPWAKYCIEYARLRDEGKLPNVDAM